MDGKIALPDSYASAESLDRILNQQGYELTSRANPLGFTVQDIRLLDVFFIGPVMVYAGLQKSLPVALRVTLVTIGVATILYNGHHYLLNRKK